MRDYTNYVPRNSRGNLSMLAASLGAIFVTCFMAAVVLGLACYGLWVLFRAVMGY